MRPTTTSDPLREIHGEAVNQSMTHLSPSVARSFSRIRVWNVHGELFAVCVQHAVYWLSTPWEKHLASGDWRSLMISTLCTDFSLHVRRVRCFSARCTSSRLTATNVGVQAKHSRCHSNLDAKADTCDSETLNGFLITHCVSVKRPDVFI